MSISSEISRISGNISDSFDAIEAKGVTVPSGSNSDSLPTLIAQIQTGASIDDTTIASDKTWSSSKISSELAGKMDAGTVTGSETLLQYEDIIGNRSVGVTAKIDPYQSGSGDPSTSNVRAISGWQKVKISVTNQNLIGGTLLRDAIKNSMPDATINETEKRIGFASSATTSCAIIGEGLSGLGLNFKFKENTKYTFIIKGYNTSTSAKSTNLRINYTDGTYVYIPEFPTNDAEKQTTLYTTSGTKTIKSFTKGSQNASTVVYYEESGIFEGTITEADFVPYGKCYGITLPNEAGTVYGGKLEVKPDGSGVLTVDKICYEFDGSNDENWAMSNTGSKDFAYIKVSDTKIYQDNIIISNMYPQGAAATNTDVVNISYSTGSSKDAIFIHPTWMTTSSTSSDIKTFLAENNLQCVVTLETPITYNFTATQITTMLGENNIWADTGDVSISLANFVDDSSTAAGTVWSASKTSTELSGKIDKPSSPASGSFLVYNGTAWVAQTLSTWSGGSY